ncbi:daunorubicin resistance protein DrrA family ABC transporter ATP-binding protein [Pseudonocardia acaciae]|uniref:daunorubicin resistance protein DrrA family ABC transporter ATP-binding protein n=1 Tax=Pseudonocardia acaciae TaxID=551276 RepID=UPI0004911E38|nr:daunorubicin resistance protein DrrA family ABC transporter ATP-binding protein [Pseudonocardia acaciae]
MSSEYSVLAEGLLKRYGDKPALDGLDLAVPKGSVFGLLGPNGAGKTTAVRILSTLIRLDGGRATVAGFDVRTEPRLVRQRIGLTGQNAAVDEILTARQNLVMFARLFHLSGPDARRRADELLERFSLTESADKQVKGFSGGMRRRLDLASSMILAPEVLFLDEPTTGLDPRGRIEVWEAVRELAGGGTTVLLTTHYLDEADKLSDRIAVIDKGHNVIEDTPAGLKRAIGGDRIEVLLGDPADLPEVAALLARISGDPNPWTDPREPRVHAAVTDRVRVLTEVANALQDGGFATEDIGLRRPTLDEVFLRLTGRPATDERASANDTEPEGVSV